jgi:hypothetical protein
MGEKDHIPAPVKPGRRQQPSWWTVLVTTLRLWLERRSLARGAVGSRRRGLLALSALVIAGLIAALLTILLAGTGPKSSAAQGRSGGSDPSATASSTGTGQESAAQIQATAAARTQAAQWVSQQVSPDAIVSCDPAMCSVLQSHGVPAGQLLVLLLADADPLGSDVVVATPAVRSQFGTRLISVYAPEVIASFGSGATRIDIRAVAPDGAQAFLAAVAADQAERITAGQQLLRNPRISASAAARGALAGGGVDPRLLVTLAALAAQQPVSIVSFGDPSPGAPAVPLRSAQVAAATRARLLSLLSFVRAQRSPYLPAEAGTVSTTGGKFVLSIEYDAPGPLGLGGVL